MPAKKAAKKETVPVVAPPRPAGVTVDQRSRRSDDDALEGHFITVVDGEHKGRFGVFDRVLETEKDGYPKTILVAPREAPNQLLTVAYKDARPFDQARR